MADLLPKFENDLIPTGGLAQADTNLPATTHYLSELAAASAATFKELAIPGNADQLKAIVETKQGEKQFRSSLASAETRQKRMVMDQVLQDAIIGGASREEIEMLLGGAEIAKPAEEAEQSILERRAAKWLVDQGIANESRATAVFAEEFQEDNGAVSKIDRQEDLVATMFRMNTIRNRLKEKIKGRDYSDDIVDLATMIFVPGHTSLTSGNVFGRKGELLGDSIKNFTDEFWNAPIAERMAKLDQFEKDLENNTGIRITGGESQNLFSAMDQLEKLMSYRDEDKWVENVTEGLDATIIPAAIFRLFKTIRSMSTAARVAGSPEVAVERTVEMAPKMQTNQYMPPDLQDEFIQNILPSLADMDQVPIQTSRFAESTPWGPGMAAQARRDGIEVYDINPTVDLSTRVPGSGMVIGETLETLGPTSRYYGFTPIEKPVGPANSAVEKLTISEEMDRLMPAIMADAKANGVELFELEQASTSPVALLETLRNTSVPSVLNEAEQSMANIQAVKKLFENHNINFETQAIIDPEKFTGGKVSIKDTPVYDISIDNINGIRTVHAYLGGGENRLQGFPSAISAEMAAVRMGLPKDFFTISEESGKFFIKVSKDAGTTDFIQLIDKSEVNEVWSALTKWVTGAASTSTADYLKGARLAVNASSKLGHTVMESVKKINYLTGDARESYNGLMLDIQQKEKWKTIGQVKSWYVDNYSRLPTEKELDAYKATVQIYEFDYLIRNAKVKQELVGAGYQEIRIKGIHKGATIGKVVNSTSVDPSLTRIFDHTEGKFVSIRNRDHLGMVLEKKGAVLVKQLHPTKAHGEYIITSPANVATKELRAEVLNKVDGPHRMYEGDHYIKQQRITTIFGKETVQNPRTHFAIKGAKEAEEWVKLYNEARDAYNVAKASGRPQDVFQATLTIAKNTRFSGFEEWDEAIKAGKMENTPFQAVRDGELPSHRLDELGTSSAIDPEFSNFTDDLKTMIENNRMFYSQRGPRLPHPKEGLATLLNPNDILSKAVGNVIHTQAYNNFRVRQIERWVKTYDKYLKGDPYRPAIEKFMYGEFDKSKAPQFRIDETARLAAEAQRDNLRRLLNVSSPFDQSVERFRDQIIDVIDKKANTWLSDRFANITSSNAIAATRGVAFKFYLGFLDLSQLVVQASMFPGMVAVSPINGGKAITSLPMLRMALLNKNDNYISHLAEMNQKLTLGSVKADTFIQLVHDIKKSGIDIIDANIGDLDNMANMGNIRSATSARVGKYTNALSFFYNEAEKANRMLGFSVAWLDNFSKTGKGLTTPEEFAAIGVRGNALSMNMAKDGKAWYQNGVMSIPMQFQGHPFRVMEVLLGPTKQMGLTREDKIRFYMGLALAYGPTLGIGDGAMASYIKEQYKNATGEDADDAVVRAITGGLVGYLFPDTDISRLQPYGQDFLLANFFDPDKGLDITTVLGPAGALGNRFYDATLGSAKLWALLGGDLQMKDWMPTTGDIIQDLAKTVSSYNRYDKALIAWQTKQLLTNKGDVLQEDLDNFDAGMIALGFPPLQSVEAFEANAALNDWTKTAVKDSRIAANYMRDAMMAEDNSSAERRNWGYAMHIIERYKASDPTGEQTEFVQRQIDKTLRDMGAYNEKVFERLNRTLGVTYRDVTRSK